MAILSIQQIMQAKDVTEKTVSVPEWGGEVVVRSISHRTMRDIKKQLAAESGTDDVSEDELEKWILIKGMVEPEVSPEEYEHIIDRSTSAVTTILTSILGSSKATDNAIKEAEKSFPDEPVGVLPVSTGGTVGEDSRRVADGIAAGTQSQ